MVWAVAALAVVLWGYGSARAATYNWTSATEADYATPGNWTASGPPGSADTAILGNSTVANGTIDFTSGDTYTLNTLTIGNVAGTTAFNMSGGNFTINKSGTDGLRLGVANGANATFTQSGGTFAVIRPTTYYQDCVSPGNTAGSTGTINLNGGTASFTCGVEIGFNGTGTVTINGANVYGTGWWDAGRGGNSGNTSQNQGSGTFNLMSGSLWLQQTNSGVTTKGLMIQQTALTGTANISGGTLVCEGIRVMNANSLAAGATPPTATLNVSGGDLWLGATGMQKPGTLASGVAVVNLSGGTFHTTNSLSPGGDVDWVWNANLPATITSGSVTFAPGTGRTITLANVFSGDGGITVAGPGTVAVNGTETYTGTTTLNGGTMSGTGSLAGSVTLNTGGTLAPGTVAAPVTFTTGPLTLNGGTALLKLSANTGSGNDQLSIQGDLTFQSHSTIKVVPTGNLDQVNAYTLLTYSGSLVSWGPSKLTVTSDNPRLVFTLLDPTTTLGSIQVTVSGQAGNLTWKGTDGTNPSWWDHTTVNWFNTDSSAPDKFFDGDNITFDDSATTTSINVVTPVQPSSLVMANTTKPFTFSGSGLFSGPLGVNGGAPLTLTLSTTPALTGITNNSSALVFNLANSGANTLVAPIVDDGNGQGTIIQAGANTLVLSGDASSYNGKLQVTNGVLQYTAATALGPSSTSLYATDTGTLDFNHINVLTKPIVIAGPGFNNQGAVNDSNGAAGAAHIVVKILTLAGDAYIGSGGRWDMLNGGTINGNGFNLTKVGSGVTILDTAGDTSLGNIEVKSGRLAFQNGTILGDTTKTLTVDSGSQLTFFALTTAVDKHIMLNDTGLLDSGGAANTASGSVTLNGTNTFATRQDLHLTGAVGGTGAMVVATNSSIGVGNGSLYLEGVNTYTGPTLLSAGGTVKLGASAVLGPTSLISLNTGSTLDASALSTDFTLGTGQKLNGIGTVVGPSSGNITFGSGSTLSVGLTSAATAPLTVNGNVIFQAGSTNAVDVNPGTSAADLVTGLTSITYGGTLRVNKLGASAYAAGNSFHLFSASTYNASAFDAIIPASPGAGLEWDTSSLTVDGTLKVIAGPQFTAVARLGDGNMEFTFTGNVNDHYTLKASTNVAKPLISWDTLTSGTITSSPLTIQDLTATNYPQRFYRLLVP